MKVQKTMDNNLNELMGLKNYVNSLIEMVLSEQEDLNKLPLNDLKDIMTSKSGDEEYSNDYFYNTKEFKDIENQRANLSGFTKRFRPSVEKELINKQFTPMDDYNRKDKKNVIGNKSFYDIHDNISDRDNGKNYWGISDNDDPDYRESIKRIKEKKDAELARIPSAKHKSHAEVAAEAKAIEIEKNKPNQNNSQRIIPNINNNPNQNNSQRIIPNINNNNPNKTAMVAGAAGIASLGVAGYAAYKLAKKRKAEKQKDKNKG